MKSELLGPLRKMSIKFKTVIGDSASLCGTVLVAFMFFFVCVMPKSITSVVLAEHTLAVALETLQAFAAVDGTARGAVNIDWVVVCNRARNAVQIGNRYPGWDRRRSEVVDEAKSMHQVVDGDLPMDGSP